MEQTFSNTQYWNGSVPLPPVHHHVIHHATQAAHTVATQGTSHMNSLLNWALIGDVVIAVAAYEVGKYGIKAVSGLIYNWYNKVFKTNVQTQATQTPVPATTHVTATA